MSCGTHLDMAMRRAPVSCSPWAQTSGSSVTVRLATTKTRKSFSQGATVATTPQQTPSPQAPGGRARAPSQASKSSKWPLLDPCEWCKCCRGSSRSTGSSPGIQAGTAGPGHGAQFSRGCSLCLSFSFPLLLCECCLCVSPYHLFLFQTTHVSETLWLLS